MKARYAFILFGLFLLCLTFSSVQSAQAQSKYIFNTDRRAGATHEDVRQLQIYLNTHGFPLGENVLGAPGRETNYFGSLTYSALVRFQEAYAQKILTPIGEVKGTGILGPYTRACINSGCIDTETSTIESSTTSNNSDSVVCNAPQGLSCIPGTSIIQPYAPAGGWTPGYGQGGGSGSSAQAISVSVSPSSATLNTFGTTTFSATVSNASNTSVNWSTSGGSINTNGVFTAPQGISATTTYTVTATSAEDSSKSGTASVIVKPIIVSISPSATSTLGGRNITFSANVANATSSAVTWSASGGSINSSGVFSAPGVTATTTYTITASSTVDSSRAATASVEVTPDLNFVGWWKLDEGTGSTALDSSGQGNNGTWSGTSSGNTGYYDTRATSTFAYAGSFDSGNDIVTIPNIDIGEARTITFWAYIPNLDGTTELVSKSSAGQGVEVIINSGTIQLWVMGSTANSTSASASDINLNAWNYITATYDGPNSVTQVYINGQPSGSSGTAPGTIGNATNLYFGTWNSGGRQFVGRLNDIRMYTKLFTAQEVLSLYNSF
ncbi:peptidoglycan-binding protein [Patescibacteria group bacterium]|nr:peptidoglycan-binding protein [Patescibacteria group bacterium]